MSFYLRLTVWWDVFRFFCPCCWPPWWSLGYLTVNYLLSWGLLQVSNWNDLLWTEEVGWDINYHPPMQQCVPSPDSITTINIWAHLASATHMAGWVNDTQVAMNETQSSRVLSDWRNERTCLWEKLIFGSHSQLIKKLTLCNGGWPVLLSKTVTFCKSLDKSTP